MAKTKEYSIVNWVVETNREGGYLSGRIRKILPNVDVHGQWNSGNKMDRIIMQAGFLNRYLYVPENPTNEMHLFLDQCYRLMKTSTKKDDAPDSLSLCSAHLEKFYRIFNEEN